MPGYALLDKYARNLPGVERMAIFSMPQTVYSYPSGQRIKSLLKRTDAEFWRILDFTFLEGGPFTDQDVANGSLVAVINADDARPVLRRRARRSGARSRPTASASA